MKKNLAKKVTLSILAGAVLMSSGVVWAAEDITDGVKVLWNDDGYVYIRNKTDNDNGIIPNDTYSKPFYGEYAPSSVDAAVNYGKVTVDGGVFNSYIYGGYSYHKNATANTVVIKSGNINQIIYGGYSYCGDATDNTVTISGGNFDAPIYGGYSNSGNAGGINDGDGNTVTIKGGTFKGQGIYGGYTNSLIEDANNNTLIINGGTFVAPDQFGTSLIAGYTYRSDGDANNNKLVITDFDTTPVEFNINDMWQTLEGFEFIAGGMSFSGDADGNEVEISGGKVAIIYGDGSIVGGWASESAQNNKVTISGCANIEGARLLGGKAATVAGNSLNIGTDGTESIPWQATDTGKKDGTLVQNRVRSIQGFDTINFNNIAWEKDGTVVEVTGSLSLASKDSNGAGGTAVTVGTVNVKTGGITANDKMHLLKLTKNGEEITGGLNKNGSSKEVTVNINEGVAKTYTGVDCDIEQTNTTIDLIIKETLSVVEDESQGGNTGGGTTGGESSGGNTGGGTTGGESGGTTPQPERNDQVLVLGESRAAATAFTNQGSELIETGLNALARDNEKDTKVFAAVYGNHSEYETGSHVNVNGWSGIVGIGKTNADGLTVGAFFENGEGNYSTHNIFTDDYIRGDGEACYNGGGFLVRKDNSNGVYAEASLRAGNLQNELRNAVRNGSELTGYDIDTFYYGAHVGVGKVISRGNDGDSIDVYGKFIYTHHDGETFDIGGTATKFDSVESERLRLGFRINEVQTNKLSMYYGAAWEYEFNGDAHDKIASFDLETPSLEGSTVIGEIGAHYKASDKWSLDLNGRAYVGQREGFSGSVQANYAF